MAPRAERVRVDLQPLPAGDLLEPVQELLHDRDLEIADRVQRFLDLAALCGQNVPAEILFHHLELDEEQREEILDLIDEDLVENEALRLFVDHQYGHPSFPGLLTYAFLSPRINHALLEPVPDAKREQMSGEVSAVNSRNVLRPEWDERLSVVPVKKVAFEAIQLLHRGQSKLEALGHFKCSDITEIARGGSR